VKALYLLLDIGTLFFPLVLSFDKKVNYFSQWKFVFIAGVIVAIPFLIWDFMFTKAGVWGFNPDYLIGIYLLNLPLEEVLFFFVVPFACVFIYACVKAYFKQINFRKINSWLLAFLILYWLMILLYGWHGAYAQSVIVSSVVTLFLILSRRKDFFFFPVSFLIVLIPFLIVNGVLTGAVTDSPVVWYNDFERTPFRISTIPVEDVLYGFTLVGLNVWVYENLRIRFSK
jgi:lycopene cyclase domain-containing protein